MYIGEIIGEEAPCVSMPTRSAIYVWGYNQSGQTGRIGQAKLLRIPKQLPLELFGCPAGANSRWLDISCGREHTAAFASDGTLFTWVAFYEWMERSENCPVCGKVMEFNETP